MSAGLGLAGAIGVAPFVSTYLFGGADFGGGVWDLLARGPRAAAQRRAVEAAIGPVWGRRTGVWLILVIVILFTGFPAAFAAISVALHAFPLTLFLVGVVLRGSAFAFRAVDTAGRPAERRFGLVFSVASTIAPLLLGTIVGALVSGRIRVRDGVVTSGFFETWLAPFPLAIGLYALALCAFLAATYLAVEVSGIRPLREDFRRRALAAGIAVGVLALLAFLLAGDGAPRVRAALATRSMELALPRPHGGDRAARARRARDPAPAPGPRRRGRPDGADPLRLGPGAAPVPGRPRRHAGEQRRECPHPASAPDRARGGPAGVGPEPRSPVPGVQAHRDAGDRGLTHPFGRSVRYRRRGSAPRRGHARLSCHRRGRGLSVDPCRSARPGGSSCSWGCFSLTAWARAQAAPSLRVDFIAVGQGTQPSSRHRRANGC